MKKAVNVRRYTQHKPEIDRRQYSKRYDIEQKTVKKRPNKDMKVKYIQQHRNTDERYHLPLSMSSDGVASILRAVDDGTESFLLDNRGEDDDGEG